MEWLFSEGADPHFLTSPVRLLNIKPVKLLQAALGEGVFSNTALSAIIGNKELVICLFLLLSPHGAFSLSKVAEREFLRRCFYLPLLSAQFFFFYF